jgi:phenylpyruvate tautomerase PptA (4-oxalocrotonate tautomerase family)
MPLWVFNHTRGAFSTEEKAALAKDITRIYTRVSLPAFYVNVQFFEMDASNIYVAGESAKAFTTVSIYHVARSFQTETDKLKFLKKTDEVLTVLKTKGMSWEYFIQEAPRELWKVNGIIPPPTGSAEEKEWLRLNRPL